MNEVLKSLRSFFSDENSTFHVGRCTLLGLLVIFIVAIIQNFLG